MTKTGIVGTFGGQNIPPVTIYMDGWVAGVRYYDKINHARVTVLGWTPEAGPPGRQPRRQRPVHQRLHQPALGKTDAQTLIGEGADIIFPVAGSRRPGRRRRQSSRPGAGNYMEWVDTDGCISAPQYCSLFITSVTKGIIASVSAAVEEAAKGTFKGGNYTGDLANNGVALAPYHDFASRIPAGVQDGAQHDQGRDHRRQDLGRPQLVPGQLNARTLLFLRPGRHGHRPPGPGEPARLAEARSGHVAA